MKRGVFVTGTDTGVGKTLAACALLHALAAHGVRASPLKPIAAGAVQREGRWINEDTLALMEAAGLDGAHPERVTPILLREPMAPHIAAEREGRKIMLTAAVEAFRRAASTGFVVCAGVGGFCVPLDDHSDSVHLARLLDLPVVLVVGMRLGCLNHALLTAQAIESASLPFAGWIANHVDPAMAVPDENVAALAKRLRAPLVGRLPHRSPPDARALATHLDISALLA